MCICRWDFLHVGVLNREFCRAFRVRVRVRERSRLCLQCCRLLLREEPQALERTWETELGELEVCVSRLLANDRSEAMRHAW
jgi:hypothetical protein